MAEEKKSEAKQDAKPAPKPATEPAKTTQQADPKNTAVPRRLRESDERQGK